MRRSICCTTAGVVALLVLSLTAAAQGAVLHFVMFGDTIDASIGVQKDLDNADDWVDTIVAQTGLTAQKHILSGSQLTLANARQMLSGLTTQSEDVIYFVYSGHGGNANDGKWPTFVMLAQYEALAFTEVYATLSPKPHRMLIVMADCCNSYWNDSGRQHPGPEAAGDSVLTTANFQRLFLNFTGTILVSASSPGEYSFGDEVNGGLFLTTFMYDFQILANSTQSLTWEKVLDTTAADVKATSTEYILSDPSLLGTPPQEPQYEIEQVGADEPSDGSDDPSQDTDSPDPSDDDSGSILDNYTPVDGNTIINGGQTSPACGAVGPLPLLLTAACWLASRRRPGR